MTFYAFFVFLSRSKARKTTSEFRENFFGVADMKRDGPIGRAEGLYYLPMAIDGKFAGRAESWLGYSESWLGVLKLVGAIRAKYAGQQVSERANQLSEQPNQLLTGLAN